jgi:hypothetical protein
MDHLVMMVIVFSVVHRSVFHSVSVWIGRFEKTPIIYHEDAEHLCVCICMYVCMYVCIHALCLRLDWSLREDPNYLSWRCRAPVCVRVCVCIWSMYEVIHNDNYLPGDICPGISARGYLPGDICPGISAEVIHNENTEYLFVCVYVCMYANMHAFMYSVLLYLIHAYIRISPYIHTCIHTYNTHAHTHNFTVCINGIHTYIHPFIATCINQHKIQYSQIQRGSSL